jgi:hypothetical protein
MNRMITRMAHHSIHFRFVPYVRSSLALAFPNDTDHRVPAHGQDSNGPPHRSAGRFLFMQCSGKRSILPASQFDNLNSSLFRQTSHICRIHLWSVVTLSYPVAIVDIRHRSPLSPTRSRLAPLSVGLTFSRRSAECVPCPLAGLEAANAVHAWEWRCSD